MSDSTFMKLINLRADYTYTLIVKDPSAVVYRHVCAATYNTELRWGIEPFHSYRHIDVHRYKLPRGQERTRTPKPVRVVAFGDGPSPSTSSLTAGPSLVCARGLPASLTSPGIYIMSETQRETQRGVVGPGHETRSNPVTD